jgi:hypothetical protein
MLFVSKTLLVKVLKNFNYLSNSFCISKLHLILWSHLKTSYWLLCMQCCWLPICNGLACYATQSPSILGKPLLYKLAKSQRSKIFLHTRSIQTTLQPWMKATPQWGLRMEHTGNSRKIEMVIQLSKEVWDNRLNILCAVSKYTMSVYNQKGEDGRVFVFII